MRTKPLLISLIAIGISVAALPARADRDSMGAGIFIGGTVGALVGGPPGWLLGMTLGAAIGEGEATRNARINGTPVYADAPPATQYSTPPAAVYLPPQASVPVTRIAPPPPGFYGVPPDYVAPRPRQTVVQYAPVQYAPRVVYPAPAYYGPRRYYY